MPLLILLHVSLDQLTKYVARANLNYHESISVIPGFFTFIKVENYGAFLSSGDTLPAPIKFVLLSLLPALVLLYGIFFLLTNRNLNVPILIGISAVIGGGIGNLYDRFTHGSVTDFMHLDFRFFQTGIFNVADLSILFGIVLLVIQQYATKISGRTF